MKSLNIVKKYIEKVHPHLSGMSTYNEVFQTFLNEIEEDNDNFQIIKDKGLTILYIKNLDTYVRYEYQDNDELCGVYITHPVIDNEEYIYESPLNKPSEDVIKDYLLSLYSDDLFEIYSKNRLVGNMGVNNFNELIYTEESLRLVDLLVAIFNESSYSSNDYIIKSLGKDIIHITTSLTINGNISFYIYELHTSISITSYEDSWGEEYIYEENIKYTKPFTYLINIFGEE